MSKETAGQVLAQVQEPLRKLMYADSSLLAFQLLVWAHLAATDKLEVGSAGAPSLLTAAGINETLMRLSMSEGVLGQAFSDAPRNAQLAGDYVLFAAKTAMTLVESGIFERFSPADIAADLLGETRGFEFGVPMELAELMVNLTVGAEQQSLYCPWEAGGQFIASLLEHDELRIHAETQYASAMPTLLSFFRHARTDVVNTNPLRSPSAVAGGYLEKFDATVSFPTIEFGSDDELVAQDLYGRFPVKEATNTGLKVQHILAQTAGTAAIVVPNSFVFGTGKDMKVREYLLNKGWVEAAIALPGGIFRGTSMPTTLLVLNTQTVRHKVAFIDATQPYFQKNHGKGKVTLENTDCIIEYFKQHVRLADENDETPALNHSQALLVALEDVFANGASLDASRYVVTDEVRSDMVLLENKRKVALEDVAQLLNPIPNKDRNTEVPEGIEVFEVGAADLPAAGYIRRPEKNVKVRVSSRRSGKTDEVFLRPFDLVLIVKGSTGKIGIVPDGVPPPGEGGWIAGQSAVVLRAANPEVDLRGLGLWLRMQMGQRILDSIKSGATIPMISIATLRKLEVWAAMLDVWVQGSVGVLEQEQALQIEIEELQDSQANVSQVFLNQLIEDLKKN
ncbi:MAG: N-6 DNA methylase [Pseudoxanthomonas sp.]